MHRGSETETLEPYFRVLEGLPTLLSVAEMKRS
jgi:hypothetical protein